jgi:hypothetical protein
MIAEANPQQWRSSPASALLLLLLLERDGARQVAVRLELVAQQRPQRILQQANESRRRRN